MLRAGWRAIKVIPPAHPERPATLALVVDRDAPGPDLMQRALDACHARGIPAAISQALRPADYAPFTSAGGTLMQELHLLSLHQPQHPTRRSGRVDIRRHRPNAPIAAVDYRAFGGFWHFDTVAINDALTATATSRLRSVLVDNVPVGYIVVGYNGSRGFVQRLAIDPDHEGRGYGGALLRDGLAWLHRRGATTIAINTQTDNTRARALYERHGFILQPERLGVIGFRL